MQLFLGFPTDPAFEKRVSQANPRLHSLFLGGGDYLSEIFYNKQRYLGKPLPLSTPVHKLESLEAHLLSLLRKLAPDYPFSENPPVLVVCIAESFEKFTFSPRQSSRA